MKINHLGIATKGIDEALTFWSDALGLENVHTEVVEDQKVRVAMLPLGESRIELLEPTSDDSPISKFLEKRGGGVHHIAVEVTEILGEKVYRRLADIPGEIDMINVFRRSQDVFPHVEAIIERKPKSVWLQLGIRDDNSAERMAKAGIKVVQDLCLMVEHRALVR